MNKKTHSFVHIGFASILMVFIMICLVTFAALSVLTANSDYRLSKKAADKTTAYYEADYNARLMARSIDTKLAGFYAASTDKATFFEQITPSSISDSSLENISDISVEVSDDNVLIYYETAVSDVQTLLVTLRVNYPTSENDNFFKILEWQTKTSNEPEESDEYLPLFGS